MDNVVYSSLLILSSILLSNLVVYGLRRKQIPGVFVFSILMLAMTIHSAGYALELLSGTLSHMYFWIRIEYIGVSFYPFLIMLFTREFADEKRFANRLTLSLLFTISLVTLVLVNTNNHHHLYYSYVGIDLFHGFNILALNKGFWYYIQVVCLFVSIIYSEIVLIIRFLHTNGEYRIKTLFVIIGVLIPMLTLFMYMLGLGPAYIDLLPFSFLFMSLCIIIGVYRHDVLAFTPITYEMVFNSIGEAVLVVDKDKRLISFNDASKQLFPSICDIKIGEPIELVSELTNYDFDNKPSVYKMNEAILNIKVNYSKHNKVIIFVISDITESEIAKKQLEVLATYDSLTGLFNRRYFMELVENGVGQGVFVMIDIDYFKKINDTYGHLEGDKVLKKFGQKIIHNFADNLSCRYGGEEFVIFIENSNITQAYNMVENMRKEIVDMNCKIKVDFSAGLSSYQSGSVFEALSSADKKLYQAKQNGRNQSVC